jgi:hypothetical protein
VVTFTAEQSRRASESKILWSETGRQFGGLSARWCSLRPVPCAAREGVLESGPCADEETRLAAHVMQAFLARPMFCITSAMGEQHQAITIPCNLQESVETRCNITANALIHENRLLLTTISSGRCPAVKQKHNLHGRSDSRTPETNTGDIAVCPATQSWDASDARLA